MNLKDLLYEKKIDVRMRLIRSFFDHTVSVFIFAYDEAGRQQYKVTDLVLEEVNEGGYLEHPSFSLGEREVADIVRDLESNGVAVESDTAQKKHLDDMRAIAFKQLKMERR